MILCSVKLKIRYTKCFVLIGGYTKKISALVRFQPG